MLEMNKKNSLYFQLMIWLIAVAAFCGLLFWGLNNAGGVLVDCYYSESGYSQRQDEKYIAKLQSYISENQIKIEDVDKISQWVKDQKVIYLDVYCNNILVFDSQYEDQESLLEENIELEYYEWNDYYSISFVDSDAIITVYGPYDYQLYNYAFIGELILTFIVFLFLVLFGIRRKINYIMQLKDEIEMLESGNLEYPITIAGRDELAILANGLDCLRQSFYEQTQSEAQMVSENQRIITQMSHDLRTPITSMLLYTTILRKTPFDQTDKINEYLDKIEGKANQMKQLTDYLFTYSLVSGEQEVVLSEPEKMKVIFYDLFSEMTHYLKAKGYQVQVDVNWSEEKVQVSTDYILRIVDNVTSNIVKYADQNAPVWIRDIWQDGQQGFVFENKILQNAKKADSTRIGINSIQNMMTKMGGSCSLEKNEHIFKLKILFPVCHTVKRNQS